MLDDVPQAVNDGPFTVVEDALSNVVSGSVLTNDLHGNGQVGADGRSFDGWLSSDPGVLAQYGTLLLNADGSYSFTLDNSLAATQALNPGEVKSMSFDYRIVDSDGDTSTATLTIRVEGSDDGVSLSGLDGEGGEVTVSDANLADGSAANGALLTQGGVFSFNAPDGVQSLSVGGVSLITAGVAVATPVVIPSGLGNSLTVTAISFNPATGAGSVSYSYTLLDNENHVQPGNDTSLGESFAVVLVDEDGDSTNDSLDVTVLDDVPQFNSVMDAVLSSHTHVAFDGRYDANFGADGLDYLSVALAGSGLYGGSAVTFVQGAPDVDGVVRVDVTNGLNVVLFSFYYETTTSAASDGGDGTVSFNAFTNPLDPDHSQFFTLTVNPDGTYTFDMISNTVISTTTVDGEDFTAFGPTYSVYTADGVPGTSDLPSLIIYGSDGDGVTDADDQVNASSQGIGVKTPTIGSGESLTFDFEKDQSYVKFSLQQFSGGGSATFMILLDGAVFDFYPLLAADGLTITKPSSGDAWVEVIVTENVGLIGTWAQTGTAAEPVYTLYVGTQFDDLKLEHDAGSLKFNVNHITYDQTIAVEDLQLNFNLAATDLDGDKAVLGDQLTVMMLDPSEPVAATAVGADANDGVVLVGNGEADVITGGTGNDILIGESDNDQLYGGGGNDLLDGGSGNDLLDGGTGSDTASYMDAGAGVTVDLNIVGAQNTVGAGQDTLVSIENLTGSDYDDILTGDDGDNVLIGGGGQDTLTGNDGSDTFKWDSGDASAGVDVIQYFQVGLGGDVLDISELLSGASDNATALEQYLTFSQGPGGSTTLVIDVDGVAGGTTQTIQFDSLDLTAGGTLSNHDIIQSLLDTENLKVVGP